MYSGQGRGGPRKGHQRFSMAHASRETRFAAVKAALRVRYEGGINFFSTTSHSILDFFKRASRRQAKQVNNPAFSVMFVSVVVYRHRPAPVLKSSSNGKPSLSIALQTVGTAVFAARGAAIAQPWSQTQNFSWIGLPQSPTRPPLGWLKSIIWNEVI